MKILGIDTSTNSANVSIVSDDEIIADFIINYKKNHSKTILSMISNVLENLELSIKDMDYLACTQGPGSFTGLRIGASTIKALAHASNKSIIPVPTLDVLAYNNLDINKVVVPIIDARRNEVYSAIYMNKENKQLRISDYMAININELIEKVDKLTKDAIFLGDGVFSNIEILGNTNYQIGTSIQNYSRGYNVCFKAMDLLKEGIYTDYKKFDIMYLRKPQAERELEEKSNDRNKICK